MFPSRVVVRAVLPPLDKPIPLERPQHVADGEKGA
jgi:hypothetical protein